MTTLLIYLTLFFATVQTEKHTLTITIHNIESHQGTLEVGLFNNGERFMEEGQAHVGVSREVSGSSETIVIKDLPSGNYAVSLYHDKNGNGECDRNFLGIPKEPYAFSNNFKPKFSKPTFEDCQFELTADKAIKIELNN
ncbi:DUF2141 domain-containing protein [Aequorivita marina]|uniref:DUF2141 domain-containing protein n=1 Tax=Aequorivita marina TaxID=3073654 RepID=UPI002874925A|nr:DUF2141 domain-containing protein [Aequorivita sp. S2608]MDS1299473.1 DUF2141 domain-containing protein [Aequorivita sp. S2608]